MKDERLAKAEVVFHLTAELGPEERESLLAEQCGDDAGLRALVERLLAHHDAEEPLLGPAAAGTRTSTREGSHPGPGRMGHYEIVRKLGEGGMGTVYEARQENPRRTVALKVIRPGTAGPSMLQRFQFEVQVLGQLKHPGIAQIYEAGEIETAFGHQPYFAMEYVQGQTLLEHAKRRRLTKRQRLELMARICDAVHHAHQKGVIHRDLKPGNILVEEGEDATGQPKILDFGVARAIHSDIQLVTMQTAPGQLVGTLSYMSPEQVAARPEDLDIRSDVYALGVILYELLTGQLPYELKNLPIPEAGRVIQEEEPSRISSIDAQYRGDSETIVAKALEKEKDRRYQSAAELGEDIRRYLRGDSIAARPPSATYQLRVFARRHRPLVWAVATVFVILVIGVIVSSSLYWRAESARAVATEERDRAREAEARAEAISEFLVKDMLASASPEEAMGREITVVEVLGNAAERVETAFPDQPELEASVRHTIGTIYLELGKLDAAEAHLTYAAESFGRILGSDHPRTLETNQTLAELYLRRNRLAEAESLYVRTLETQVRLFGEDDPATFETRENLGVLRQFQGRSAEAESIFRESLEKHERVLGRDDPETWEAGFALAYALGEQARYEEAANLYRQVLEKQRRGLGNGHPSTLGTMNNLATTLNALGKWDEAEALSREAVDLERSTRPEHPDFATSLANLALYLETRGKVSEADSLYREALAIRERTLGEDHPSTIAGMRLYGRFLVRSERLSEAEDQSRRAYELAKRALGDDHATTLACAVTYGAALWHQGRLAEAEPLYREGYEGCRRVFGEGDPRTLRDMAYLGSLLSRLDRVEEGESLTREALRVARDALEPDDALLALILDQLGSMLMKRNEPREAEPYLREAWEIRRKRYPRGNRDREQSRSSLLSALRKVGKMDEAESIAQEALAICRESAAVDSVALARALMDLGNVLMDKDQPARAEPCFREAYELRRQALGPDHRDTLTSLRRIGWSYQDRGQLADAEPYYVKTLEGRRRSLGESHEHTLIVRRQLTGIWRDLGRFDDAESLARETLELAKDAGEIQVLWAHHALAKVLLAKGEPGAAEPHLRAALAIAKTSFPADGDEIAQLKQLLETCLAEVESTSTTSP